jgi:HJR/Mrr/RecB family endonuclease
MNALVACIKADAWHDLRGEINNLRIHIEAFYDSLGLPSPLAGEDDNDDSAIFQITQEYDEGEIGDCTGVAKVPDDWLHSDADEEQSEWRRLSDAYFHLRHLRRSFWTISEAIELRNDTNTVSSDLDLLFSAAAELGIRNTLPFEERLSHLIREMEIVDAEELYAIRPHSAGLVVPEPLLLFKRDLLSYVRDSPSRMWKLSAHEFEELVAKIFQGFGFKVFMTKKTHDEGRDIIAINKANDIAIKYVIECKRYTPPNKVGIGIVQRMIGVRVPNRANKAILVTSSYFTQIAFDYVKRNRLMWDIDLKDYDDICRWLRQT